MDEKTVIAALEAAAETNGYTAQHGVESTRASIHAPSTDQRLASGVRVGSPRPVFLKQIGAQSRLAQADVKCRENAAVWPRTEVRGCAE